MNPSSSTKTFIVIITLVVTVLAARAMKSRGGCPACLLLPKEMTEPQPKAPLNP
jgi:hypothetical protein